MLIFDFSIGMEENNQMKDVILWGSGDCGKYMHQKMMDLGRNVIAFGDVDSNKVGNEVCGKKIISYQMIKNDYKDADIVISIQAKDNEEIREQLKAWGLLNNIFTLQEFLSAEIVMSRRDECAEFHNKHMDSYFDAAELDNHIRVFWEEQTVFKRMFDKLDKEKIVELACGRGRHVPQYINETKEIVLVDILERNIQYCKERFAKEEKIQYYVNSGNELNALKSGYYSSIFSYDSMVHFESIDVYHYLLETGRILMPGGRALFHHSNNYKDYKASFMTGLKGRSYMSMDLFAHFADRAGLRVVEQIEYPWGDGLTDGITLLQKD